MAIDGMLLELEKTLDREGFRRNIVAAILEAREEFEDQCLGTLGYSNTPTV